MGVGVLFALLAGPLPARSATSGADAAELRTLVEELQHEVALLQRKLEVQQEDQARTSGAPLVGAGPDGFTLRSPDKAYELKLRGYTHFDGRTFIEEDGSNTNTFLFRRIRPLLEGTLGGSVDFRIMPDFAGSQLSLQDAFVNLRGVPWANLQAGKYKAPFGLERLQSATALLFPERALPTNLVPNRDLGLMLHGSLGEGILQYQLAFSNGVVDGGSADLDPSDGKDVVARVFAQPFQDRTEGWLSGLGVGVAFDYGATDGGGSTPSYRTAGQSVFFAYQSGTQQGDHRLRYSPQLSYTWGPFGLLGEYVSSTTGVRRQGNDAELENRAWQVAASWVLTGENASYRGVQPLEDFSLEKGSFGALEVAARANELRIDPDAFDDGFALATASARRARAFGVGTNWYLNRWTKLMFAYERTFFQDGAGSVGNVSDRDDESVFFMRTQLSF